MHAAELAPACAWLGAITGSVLSPLGGDALGALSGTFLLGTRSLQLPESCFFPQGFLPWRKPVRLLWEGLCCPL